MNSFNLKHKLLRTAASVSLLVTTLFTTIPAADIVYAAPTTAATQATTAASSTQTATATNTQMTAPIIASQSAILIDADTGAILYQKDAYERCYPASTTKILTGLLTIENSKMDETVTFSSAAANSVTWEDAQLGTKAGEEYSVEQALYGLLLYSANEIAYGLAEHVGGTLNNFTDMMNRRAKELGATNTHFTNASGLYDPNHYTTAYDMAMIARGCYNNSTFVNIDSTSSSYTIGPTNLTAENRTFRHRHQMLANRPYYYEYCKGGKTGYTDQSGATLVTFAEKNNMRLICVCFKSSDTERFTDTRTLFDWGFDNFQKVTISGDAISSLFSNATYYNSAVFGKHILFSNLNATTLTIPNKANVGDIRISVAQNNPAANTDATSYTTNIDFWCQDNIVGTTTLMLSSNPNMHANALLPYREADTSQTQVSAKKCLAINIWILIAIIAAIILTVILIRSRSPKNKRSRKRELHF